MVIQQYQDPSVSRVLKFGFWYQEHKTLLIKTLIGALIAVNAMFWVYTFYGAAQLITSVRSDAQLYGDLTKSQSDVLAIHSASAPKALSVLRIAVVASASESDASGPGVSRADFLAHVENPNPEWIMRVSYAFTWAGGQTGRSERIILPESQAYLGIIGAAVSGLPADASLDADISWERVRDPRILVRPRAVLDGIRAGEPETGSSALGTDIRVIVANESPYTVIAPDFLFVAERVTGEPAAAWIQTETIAAGGVISAERRFLRSLPPGLSVSSYPVFDMFDDGAYRLRGGGFVPL